MEILILITQITGYLILTFLLLSGLYFLFFAAASFFYHDNANDTSDPVTQRKKVAILIPAYKEDYVIIETAVNAKKHASKQAECDVIVIADQLKPFTQKVLDYLKITVIPVYFRISSKSKSIRYALSKLKTDYDYTVVLDADNLLAPDFIDNIISKLNSGYKIVQGHRVAKNKNTRIATLDAISEAVNNNIFRIGHRAVGLSASLIGSGFAAEYQYFKSLIDQSTSIGGFDKELELMILNQGDTIGYSKKAVVLDEKIQDAGGFVNQRRRWLSAQFVYLRSGINKMLKGKANRNYLDKIIQFLLPPRVIAMGVSLLITLLTAVSLFFEGSLNGLFWCGLVTFMISISSVAIATPKEFYNSKTLASIWSLPKGFILTMVALLRIKNANKRFLHTTHRIAELR